MQFGVDPGDDLQHRGRVHIAVKAMRDAGLTIGEALVLRNKANPALFAIGTAWPSNGAKDRAQVDRVTMTSLGLAIGEAVVVSKLAPPFRFVDAQKVSFACSVVMDQSPYLVSLFLQCSLAGRYVKPKDLVAVNMYGKPCKFTVEAAEGQGVSATAGAASAAGPDPSADQNAFTVFRVNYQTKILIVKAKSQQDAETSTASKNPNKIDYSKVGGLGEQIRTLRELVELPLRTPEIFSHFGIRPPRGVLLYGPPGTGKTLLATAAAESVGVKCFPLSASEVSSKYFGESENKLRDVFKQASENAPSIIFIDELDALAPKRDQSDSEVTKRIVGTLLALMDGMDSKGDMNKVVVIAATNRPNALDPALRRPGRFDREIEIPIPNEQARRDILQVILKSMPHSLSPENVGHLASVMHGYVGADIVSLCKEAALLALKRAYDPLVMTGSEAAKAAIAQAKVTLEDMMGAFADIRPSAMREVLVDIPKVKWTDIGGYEEVKQKLREAVEWPIKHPESFTRLGIEPPKGVLLYGPPGCSKTLMAKALATEAGLNFIPIKGPELFSKYVGDSEKAVRDVFRKARQAAPSVVFFDEIDAVGVERGSEGNSVHDRVLAQMLTELDGIEALRNVLFLAATNRPDIIDKALMRPGRLDRILFVGPPDVAARQQIFAISLRKIPHNQAEVSIEELARMTEGLTGAEVTSLCREACLYAMQENIDVERIEKRHFVTALSKLTTRTVTPEMLAFFQNFQKTSSIQSV